MHSSSNGSATNIPARDFKQMIEVESWDSIAHLAMTFTVDFEADNKETKRLKKEIAIVKHILHEHLKNPDYSDKFVNGSFFITLVRCIDKFELAFDKHKSKQRDFLIFLKAILSRIKKEKLIVHKPIERKTEFKKMKDVVENGRDLLETSKNRANGHST